MPDGYGPGKFKVTWEDKNHPGMRFVALYKEEAPTAIENIPDNFILKTKRTQIKVVCVEELG
jgi:hypothetical protein